MPRIACPSAVVAALAALLAAGAGPAAAAETTAFVLTTDFQTGNLRSVVLDTRGVSADRSPFICADARMRWAGGLLYVVNRLGCDNVLVLDPAHGYSVVREFSVGNGSNPSDIAVLSPTKAYVARYELASLLIVDPSTGATLGQISLAPFADADGIPEMDRMIQVGGRVFVSLQRLDRDNHFRPTDRSLIAVIDAVADTVIDVDPVAPGVQAIALGAKNPFTDFAFDPGSGHLLIGCAGVFGVDDGGIEWVDPIGLQSLGLAITESALGGDVDDLAWNGSSHSYAIVSDSGFNTSLVSWSAISGTKLGTMFSPGGFSLADCEVDDRGEIYLCDNQFTAPGLFVFSTADDQMIAGPLDTGLPPNQVIFDVSSAVTGVGPGPTPAGLALSPPRPNPTGGAVDMSVTLERPGAPRIEVFDPTGRRVRDLSPGPLPAGITRLTWDLRLARGLAAPPGVYWIRVRVGEKMVVRPLAIVY